ncbi:MAG: tannase/feruloyl esterase family alpha/beta hydrolase [Acidobacteria bacterium]|nr:tannase/feruloyl esterase family alpha/beta hydrolase [Acidobacteriota bacterium]
MNRTRHGIVILFALSSVLVAPPAGGSLLAADEALSKEEAGCRALERLSNLTIISAQLRPAEGAAPQHCYIRGIISPAIHWHMQLPLPANWNGRLLNLGDGGKDGDLDFSDQRLAQGYAVANSNTGHDNGAEPYASFAWNNRQAEIDFGYRAVHLTANASKTLVKSYYGKDPSYSYFEGCSTGGRQGIMEAQRFPYDFDGIVVGAPVIYYQRLNMAHVWSLQRLMQDNFAGSLAYDIAGDGSYASLTKVNMLRNVVLAKCDAKDGVKDGVIEDPLNCDFKPEVDLKNRLCPGDQNADECFTRRQLQTIKDLYSGPYDSKGNVVFKGQALGSEFSWARNVIPYGGNKFFPSHLGYEVDHVNFLFYENDPGVAPPDPKDLSYKTDRNAPFPEVAWWEFNIDDVTAGKGDFMAKITDATDPDLTRFLNKKNGKLIIYQGWGDGDAHPEPTLDYYKEMVSTTFKGDVNAAREKARLFMVPGMGHCGGGPGPNEWDKLPALLEWVEKGKAPDYIVAVHRSDQRGEAGGGPVDNERKVCPYPQRAVYTGPAGGQNNPANWVHTNFTCR